MIVQLTDEEVQVLLSWLTGQIATYEYFVKDEDSINDRTAAKVRLARCKSIQSKLHGNTP